MATCRLLRLAGVAFAFCAAAAAASEFESKPANKYPAKQAQGEVTVAVKPYLTEDLMKEAFGKAEPYRYGFLPVLVVITNGSKDALSLEDLKVRFITSDRTGLEPWPAEDLASYNPKGHKPKDPPPYVPRIPGVTGAKVKKGPLAKEEISLREFKAPVAPPRSTASGFFYYQVGTEARDPLRGAAIYVSGIRNLTTGQELFYFEIPLEPYAD